MKEHIKEIKKAMTNRSYYSKTIQEFFSDSNSEILGLLSQNHCHSTLEELQITAWLEQINLLKVALKDFSEGHIFFEFSIPRMGKRVDNILIINGIIFVLEFKVNSTSYDKFAIDQVNDYAIDLKNFHEGSHSESIIPILISTEADNFNNDLIWHEDKVSNCQKANKNNLSSIIEEILSKASFKDIDPITWELSQYKPTPTIIEAAKALYSGHNVKDISRSDSGAKNLSITSECIFDIVKYSKENKCKSICFVTGVPGSGKTLAGLNIATNSMKHQKDEYAVFLSGNGPLVDVLREALARDEAVTSNISKSTAKSKVKAFIQNIHHFRDEGIKSEEPPIERVVIFDEAQRAWDKEQASKFMQQKRGLNNFNHSEPEFLISLMDRHLDWCLIICLVGGGQEINTGEAGLIEWFNALKNKFPHWEIFYSNQIKHTEYTNGKNLTEYLSDLKTTIKHELHLAVSIRSFRSESLAEFIRLLIDNKPDEAKIIYKELKSSYPIYLSRDINKAKIWIKNKARGTERYGIITSSGAIRLKPDGINVKADIEPPIWFLNANDDIRSSYFLEDVATEFDIQGLELDWIILAWDANLRYVENEWNYFNFSGTKWQNAHSIEKQKYLLNSYRVLLTRARQGMVIYVPTGDKEDITRLPDFYDGIYEYLRKCGIEDLKN